MQNSDEIRQFLARYGMEGNEQMIDRVIGIYNGVSGGVPDGVPDGVEPHENTTVSRTVSQTMRTILSTFKRDGPSSSGIVVMSLRDRRVMRFVFAVLSAGGIARLSRKAGVEALLRLAVDPRFKVIYRHKSSSHLIQLRKAKVGQIVTFSKIPQKDLKYIFLYLVLDMPFINEDGCIFFSTSYDDFTYTYKDDDGCPNLEVDRRCASSKYFDRIRGRCEQFGIGTTVKSQIPLPDWYVAGKI